MVCFIFSKIVLKELIVKIDGTSDANNFSGKSTPKSAVGTIATERMSTQFFGLTTAPTVSGSATFDEVQQVQQCVASQAVSAACAAAVQVKICINISFIEGYCTCNDYSH